MRLVGMQALGAARGSCAAVVMPTGDLAGDLAAVVRAQARTLAHVLMRVAVAALRSCRPAATAVLASVRTRSAPAGAVRAAQPPVGVLRLVTQAEDAGRVRADEPGAAGRRHEAALPADPTAPRRARALLQAAVTEWDVDDDLHQDAAMVVTELVANAVDHAGTPSTVTVTLDDRELCVAVRDGRPDTAPRPRPVDPTAPRGRGLQMVDALTTSWGVTVHADGKTVWAVLSRN
jgi:anti-sigma regulatory factor (Ser/Thr protein kinase)